MGVMKSKRRARASRKKNSPTKTNIEKKTDSNKKPKSDKTLLIAQEVKFARLLANNDKKVRDKVLKNLKKWLTARSQSSFEFTEADFMRLWKGLFYCMWMSDKPLVQEELAESLSQLVHCFMSIHVALRYTKCCLKSLADEWFGIDRYRLDKFEMLVRKIIRQTFVMCKNQSWDRQWVIGVANCIENILVNPRTCLGFNLHLTDVYMEELAKISDGTIPEHIVTDFIKPYVVHLASASDERQIKHVLKNIFRYLIFQSDIGQDYTEKFNAWRQANFPCKSIDEMQRVEISDDEDVNDVGDQDSSSSSRHNSKPLDPRAGRVDVEIPQLPFNANDIAALLRKNKFHPESTSKTRKHITRLIHDFEKLSQGDMPFGIKEISISENDSIDRDEATEELLNLEKELHADSSKNYRKRKRNGDLSTDSNIEELFPDQSFDESLLKSKKPKVTLHDIISKSDLAKKNFQTQTRKNDAFKSSLSIKSHTLSSGLLKERMKKCALTKNTFSESIVEPQDAGDQLNISSGSTSCNWNVDTPIPLNSTPTYAKSPKAKKITKDDRPPSKKKTSLHELQSNISWLTPVLTRLEEQKKVSKMINANDTEIGLK
ncbi:hypothetical protein QAD02_003939 [Eretmocerus hayati]|uniref:Uncharacterized protein n=1 Tax=Eretmocerus hayati TaxID=131215 RepID=A0ACC2NQU2_9HYME|nr:hypothetical protein QAD02_003939 [Eretmocerus hayati]